MPIDSYDVVVTAEEQRAVVQLMHRIMRPQQRIVTIWVVDEIVRRMIELKSSRQGLV